MERVVGTKYKGRIGGPRNESTLVVGRPPWTEFKRSGKLERLILQLGRGKGAFSEITGIPRSMGCIGNNRFILRRKPLTVEEVEGILDEFKNAGGRELWLNSYDDVKSILHAAVYAREIGIPEVYAVILLEDLKKLPEVEIDGVKIIAEFMADESVDFSSLREMGVYGVLIITDMNGYPKLQVDDLDFDVVLVDVLYPPNINLLSKSFLSLKLLPVNQKERHPCMSGMIAITGDGYVVPCPIIRGYIIGDIREEGLSKILRKRRLRSFWKIMDSIDECSSCPLKGMCHDCRAVNYQITGDILGVEYCGREILKI